MPDITMDTTRTTVINALDTNEAAINEADVNPQDLNKPPPPDPPKKRKVGKIALRVIIALILTVATGGSMLGFMSYSKYLHMRDIITNSETIYKNIIINGVDVGELSKAEALKKVNGIKQKELEEKQITLKSGNMEYIYKFGEFKVSYDFSGAVDEAYNYARTGTTEERYDQIKALETTPYEITYEPSYTYDDTTVYDKIGLVAPQVYVEPVNATIDRVDGQFIITKEIPGRQMDKETTAAEVKNILAQNRPGTVDIALSPVAAQFKEEDVAKAQSLIGSFYTTFSQGANGRNTNIANAANKVNNTTLQPGEIFSTNNALGPSTVENGYAVAPVIVGGKLEEDVGGGVCQVSSTLYNAVLFAELEVVERTNHSLKVGYLDYGFDATLAGDYLDFKFKNNTNLPIFIECIIEGGRLTANIYGIEIHEPGRELKFHNQLLETIQPGADQIVYDSTLPQGKRVVSKGSRTGLKFVLYKTVYQDGVEVMTEQVNISRYKATPAEVRVGTGSVPSRTTVSE
ncbi:MAG: VanW family protein [Clostridiales bacterium]|jgi:vancomycin resistance protein YoaR|nr:VanW family protein [Clostridiales bacterium]